MIPKWESTLNEMVLLLEEWHETSRGKLGARIFLLQDLAHRLFKEIKKEVDKR